MFSNFRQRRTPQRYHGIEIAMRCNALLTQDAAFAVLSIKKLFCSAYERNRCWCERLLYSKVRMLSRGELAGVRCVVLLFTTLARKILRIYKLEIDDACYFLGKLRWLDKYACLCVYCTRCGEIPWNFINPRKQTVHFLRIYNTWL